MILDHSSYAVEKTSDKSKESIEYSDGTVDVGGYFFYYNVLFCQGTHTGCSLLHMPQDLLHYQSLLLKVRLHRHEGTAGITAIEHYLYSVFYSVR